MVLCYIFTNKSPGILALTFNNAQMGEGTADALLSHWRLHFPEHPLKHVQSLMQVSLKSKA